MISVDFKKLKELYAIVNKFESSVSGNLSRAEAQNSSMSAQGEKLLRHLNEIKRFLDDEISRYKNLERKLNNEASGINFTVRKSLNSVYVGNISENTQMKTINQNAAFFEPLVLSGDAGFENKSSKVELKNQENLLDKSLKTVENNIKSATDMTEKTADELKNFAENTINELGKIENFIKAKIDGILAALVKELDCLENEIFKVAADKNLKDLGDDGFNIVKTKVEEFFTFDKDKSKGLSEQEEKYKNNLKDNWDNFKTNVWEQFKKDHPWAVEKLMELKNEIETEIKTAWCNFEKSYPILAQILKVSGKIVKGISEGSFDVLEGLVEAPFDLIHMIGEQAYDFTKDPVGTAKKWLIVGADIYTFLNGEPPLTSEQVRFRAGLVQMIKASINKNLVNGDAETRSRFITNVAGNIVLFLGTDGASAAGKVDDAGRAVEAVNDAEKTEAALSTAGKAEGWWSKAEDPLKIFYDLNKSVSKATDTLKSFIDTKINQLFTVVSETKDLGSSILFKFRNSVENVKEIVISKCGLTEPQIETCIKGCFTGETLVNTELGLRKIDSIKEGDKVYAEDVTTGEKALKKVLYVYKKQSKDIIIITIGEQKIETTAPHLFYTENGWEPAERIKVGCKIKNVGDVYEVVSEINVRHVKDGEAIYNLNVEEYHTYFVGENSVLVHNDCSVSDEDVKTLKDAANKWDDEIKEAKPSGVKDGSATEGVTKASPSEIAQSWQGDFPYVGVDKYRNITLKKGKVIYVGDPYPTGYATTKSAVDRINGDSRKLFEGLQVKPYWEDGMDAAEYRSKMMASEIKEDTDVAFGITKANQQFGNGGLPQMFIPDFN